MIPEFSPRFHYMSLGGYCTLTHHIKQAAEAASFYEWLLKRLSGKEETMADWLCLVQTSSLTAFCKWVLTQSKLACTITCLLGKPFMTSDQQIASDGRPAIYLWFLSLFTDFHKTTVILSGYTQWKSEMAPEATLTGIRSTNDIWP